MNHLLFFAFRIFDPRRVDTALRVTSPSLDPSVTRSVSNLCIDHTQVMQPPPRADSLTNASVRFLLLQDELGPVTPVWGRP